MDESPYASGGFVIAFPKGNRECAEVVDRYRGRFLHQDTIEVWFLEDMIGDFQRLVEAGRIDALADRYIVG